MANLACADTSLCAILLPRFVSLAQSRSGLLAGQNAGIGHQRSIVFWLATVASRAEALAVAYASTQDEYEYDGVASLIILMDDGSETRIDWEPNHEWLDFVAD